MSGTEASLAISVELEWAAWWLTPVATLVILRESVKRGSQPRPPG